MKMPTREKQDRTIKTKELLMSEKSEIESLLNDISDPDLSKYNKSSGLSDSIQDMKREKYTNFDDLKDKANTRAQEIIQTLIEYNINRKFRKDRLISMRIADDSFILSSIIFQIYCSELNLKKYYIQLDEGFPTSKDMEAVSKLQATKMDLLKNYIQVKTVLESQYKSMDLEYKERLRLQEEAKREVNPLIGIDIENARELKSYEEENDNEPEPTQTNNILTQKELLQNIRERQKLLEKSKGQ